MRFTLSTGLFSCPLRLIGSMRLREYFGEKYSVAETVSHLGANTGGILLPYVTAQSLQAYGLRGAMLLLAAWFCHLVPFGFTMRASRQSKPKNNDLDQEQSGSSAGRSMGESRTDRCKRKRCIQTTQNRKGEHEKVPLERLNEAEIPDASVQGRTSPMSEDRHSTVPAPGDVEHGQSSADGINRPNDETKPNEFQTLHNETSVEIDVEECRQKLLEEGKESDVFEDLNETDGQRRGSGDTVDGSQDDMSNTTSDINKVFSVLWSMFDLQVLKEEPILTFIYLPCQLLWDIFWTSWLFFMASYGVSQGMSVQRAVFLPMTGNVGALCGRIIVIAIMYRKHELAQQLIAVGLGIASCALLLYPLNSSLGFLIFCSFVTGFGFNAALTPVHPAISLIVKEKNFSGALSYSLFLSGVGIVIGGPFTGI